jgi:hypothetical protein
MGALAALVFVAAVVHPALGWGYSAHRIVTEAAIRDVPGPLGAFLLDRLQLVSDLSLEPDTRLKQDDPDEAHRHYFEVDLLLPAGPADVSSVPHDLPAARRKYGDAMLRKTGILPWWIAVRTTALAEAMRRGDADAIIHEAAYLSHYVADLHQPLHLTRNFDGQLTGNDGVHAAFERFLIERGRESFRPAPGGPEPLRRIDDPAGWALERAAQVYPSAREVLDADHAATVALKSQGANYWRAFDERAGALAAQRLDQAARATAALWISAWIEAGKPDPASWGTKPAAPRRAPAAGRAERPRRAPPPRKTNGEGVE